MGPWLRERDLGEKTQGRGLSAMALSPFYSGKSPPGHDALIRSDVRSVISRAFRAWVMETDPKRCLENPRDVGASLASIYGVAELNTTEAT